MCNVGPNTFEPASGEQEKGGGLFIDESGEKLSRLSTDNGSQ